MQDILTLSPFMLLGYLCGSIPCGLLITRAANAGDIRRIGSGNIGATNVLRTGRKSLAALTLLCDMAKGAAAVLLAEYFGLAASSLPLVALAAAVGHVFPVWLRFRGGKGVATALGGVAATAPILGACIAMTWLLMAAAFRISSLAALTAFMLMPIAAYFLAQFNIIYCVLTVLIFATHKDNIQRLIRFEEPKIGK